MDEPPALNDLPSQVAAASGPKQACEFIADVTLGSTCQAQVVKSNSSIRKGFFNAKPKRQPNSTVKDDFPLIKPKAGAAIRSNIPELFMVEPNEDMKRVELHKKQVLQALKPTEKSIAQVMSIPHLAGGFDDPEIMRAVEEIGKNPQLIHTKYAKNANVAQFYKAMAAHVGQQLCQRGADGH